MADELVDEQIEGHGRSERLVTHAKMLRLERLNVKADLERELEDFPQLLEMRPRRTLGQRSRRATPGHWAHRDVHAHGDLKAGCRSPAGRSRTDAGGVRPDTEDGGRHRPYQREDALRSRAGHRHADCLEHEHNGDRDRHGPNDQSRSGDCLPVRRGQHVRRLLMSVIPP
jgi:hypothetical protein